MTDLSPLPEQLTQAMNAGLHRDDPLIGDLPVPETGPDVVAELPAGSGRAVGIARVRHLPLDSALTLWQASTHEFLQLRHHPEATAADIAEVLDGWLALAPGRTSRPRPVGTSSSALPPRPTGSRCAN